MAHQGAGNGSCIETPDSKALMMSTEFSFANNAPATGLSSRPEIQVPAYQGDVLTPDQQTAKRVFDAVLAAGLLFVFSPLLMLIAAAIRLTSPGPALFKQPRWGHHAVVFNVYKFRTMYTNCGDQLCRQQTAHQDPRVTPLGRFLRRTSLDELPQLLNVLKGDMSLVGPRPHALGMTVEGRPNADAVQDYFFRYRVKPGLTGWAQVNGYRGPADTIEHLAQRVSHDLAYIKNWSLLFDLQILIKTAFKVLNDRNAR
jgi:lipopolysaccharide/colanic/teichoic acid biosynthesis glycosyltransferase